MSVNNVILIGRLGKDPEVTYSKSGVPFCRFSLATNEKFKDQDGKLRERTEWHNIVCFAKLAEVCGQYLNKGCEVYIEGPIRTRQWEDRDGNQRTSFNIVARRMQMFSSAHGNGSKPKTQAAMPAATSSEEDNPFSGHDTTEPDVPF